MDEICLYFMSRGCKNIKVHCDIEENKILYHFEFNDCSRDSYDYFKKKLSPHHQNQFEGYGWELMGDGDYNELEILGGLIDELTTSYQEGKIEIRMVRLIE